MTFSAEISISGDISKKLLQEGFKRCCFVNISVFIEHRLSSAIAVTHYKLWEVPAH